MLNLNHIHGTGDAFFAVTMLLGCLLFGSYPVLKLIGWWADGGVEPLMAAMAIFLYLVILVSVTFLPPALAILLLLVIIASAVLMPVLGQVSEDRQNQRILDEQMQRFAGALQENPMNHAARLGLAEALHKRGEVDRAIEHMEWVLQQSPALAMRVRPQLDTWKRQKERQGTAPPIICHLCAAENHPYADRCYSCGAAFGTRASVVERMRAEGGPAVVIRGWIVTATTLILACFLLLVLPAIIAGPIILASVIVAAWLFLRWIGGDMGTVGN